MVFIPLSSGHRRRLNKYILKGIIIMALTDESNGTGMYMPVAPAYGGGNGFGNHANY